MDGDILQQELIELIQSFLDSNVEMHGEQSDMLQQLLDSYPEDAFVIDPTVIAMMGNCNCPTVIANLDALRRYGGFVNGYNVTPRPRFNSVELRRTMNMRDIRSADLASYHTSMHEQLDEIVSFARHVGGDSSVINLTMNGESLRSPVSAVLTSGNDYDVGLITDQIEKILQSNEELMSDDRIEIEADVVMNRLGGAWKRRKLIDLPLHQVIKRKKMSLFAPVNISNNLCCSICLAHFLEPQIPENELESRAAIIQRDAGFSIQDKIGLHDLAKFENLLDIKIVVFYRTSGGALETYKNYDEPHPKTVYLYLQDEHYYMILKLTAFIGAPYVCQFCYKGYTNRRTHHCKYVCDVCFDNECSNYPKRTIHCDDCQRYCNSRYCYERHKEIQPGKEKSSCDTIKYCTQCGSRYTLNRPGAKHTCRPSYCGDSHEELHDGGKHLCYIQPKAPRTPSERLIFYDFETCYENGWHVANFVCAITYSGKRFVAQGTDCVEKLITHFRKPRYEGYCFIAHYAARFDSFLILEYLCKAGITRDIIMQGCKLIFMHDEAFNQRYIDSYSFIPMALSKMPAALALTTTGKGYFPHHFNRLENADYVGPYPDKSFYGYDNMSDKDQAKFDAWYATVIGKEFCFKSELYDYGVNDVILLREGCMKYRDAFIDCTGIDPFNFTTLASCCMGVFKANHLSRNTLALTRNNKYVRSSKTYSSVSTL